MRAPVLILLSFVLSCGAKTGLPIPVIEECYTLDLERPTPQVLFAIDRSGSMDFSLNGLPPDDPERRGMPSRWDLMGPALGNSLAVRDGALEFGAVFFPELIEGDDSACGGNEFVSIAPGSGTVDGLRAIFRSTAPIGGTPSGSALRVAREHFADHADDVVPFVVLVTDGAPNCNPEPAIPPPACQCTSPQPDRCDPFMNADAPLHCLDQTRAVEEIRLLVGAGVPVYVLGITQQEALAAVLDELAVEGGRPRPVGERRFYDARTEAELGEALDAITGSITSCAFSLRRAPPDLSRVRVFLGDTELVRDPSHMSGWDFSNPEGTVIALYGSACAEAEDLGAMVSADLFCDQPDAGPDAGADI